MRYLSLGAVLVTAALVGGCGSSSSSSSTSSSPSAASSSTSGAASSASSGVNVQGAKQNAATIVSTTPALGLPKLGAAVPKGKTITYINCALAICTEVGTGVQQAATALGWHVRNIEENLTPAGYLAAWQQIEQNPGNGVVSATAIVPDSAPSMQAIYKKANVPVVMTTDIAPPSGHVISVTESPGNVYRQGEAEADWVVQDAGKPVKTLFAYDPTLSSIAATLTGYRSALTKYCPKCTAGVLKVSSAQIGPKLAQQVVSYLQANPDVKYVVFGLGDLATGVPAAIKAAGLANQVKVVVRAATPPNLEDVKSGGVAAAFTDEVFEAGWRADDAILRFLVKKPIDPYPHGKVYLITKSNLPPNITVPYTTPGYGNQFKLAWGAS